MQSHEQQQYNIASQPINYNLFSLEKLVHISTGSYPHSTTSAPSDSESLFLNTNQWKEQPFQTNDSFEMDPDEKTLQVKNAMENGEEIVISSTNNTKSTKKVLDLLLTEEEQDLLVSAPQVPTVMPSTDSLFFNNFYQQTTTSQPSKPSLTPISSPSSSTTDKHKSTTPISPAKDLRRMNVHFKQIITSGQMDIFQCFFCLLSSDTLLIYFKFFEEANSSASSTFSLKPIVKTISFFKDSQIKISGIALEDEQCQFGSCITSQGDIYLIPIHKLVFPTGDSLAQILLSNNRQFHISEPLPNTSPNINNTLSDTSSTTSSHTSNTNSSSHRLQQQQQQQQEVISVPSIKEYTNWMSEMEKLDKKGIQKLDSLQQIEKAVFTNPMQGAPTTPTGVPTPHQSSLRLYNSKRFGMVTCCIWWKLTQEFQKHFLIMGTDAGYLYIYNLQTQVEECVIPGFKNAVRKLEIIVEPSVEKKWKYLMVTSTGGNYYKICLEYQDVQMSSRRNLVQYYRNESTYMAAQSGGLLSTKQFDEGAKLFSCQQISFLNKEYPNQCAIITTSAQQHPFCVSYSKSTHQCSVYDALHWDHQNSNEYPLFVYQCNHETNQVFMTNHLLFTVQRNESQDRCWILSKFLSTSHSSSVSKQQQQLQQHNKAKQANVLQEFLLPQQQRICGLLPRFCSHSTEEQGLFLWTQNAILECKPQYSPQQIFKQLIQEHSLSIADQFGKSFPYLDMFQMYEQCAMEAFVNQQMELAVACLEHCQSKSWQRIVTLYQQQVVSTSDACQQLIQLLASNTLSVRMKQQLSHLILELLFFSLLRHPQPQQQSSSLQSNTSKIIMEDSILKKYNLGSMEYLDWQQYHRSFLNSNTWNIFRNFCLENTDYNAQVWIPQLLQRHLICLALEVAAVKQVLPQIIPLLSNSLSSFHTHAEILFAFLYDMNQCQTVWQSCPLLLHCCANNPTISLVYWFQCSICIHTCPILEKKKKHIYHSESNSMILVNHSSQQVKYQQMKALIPFVKEIDVLSYMAEWFDPFTTLLKQSQQQQVTLQQLWSQPSQEEEEEYFDMLPKKLGQVEEEELEEPLKRRIFYYPNLCIEDHVHWFILICLQLIHCKVSQQQQQQQVSIFNCLRQCQTKTYPFYTQEKLEECLRFCYLYYDSQECLQMAQQLDNKSACVILYEMNQQYHDAMRVKCQQIQHSSTSTNQEEVVKKLQHSFEKYLVKSEIKSAEMKAQCLECWMNCWNQCQLPMRQLEDYCFKYLSHIHEPLLQILFFNTQPLLTFSASFLCKCTLYFVKQSFKSMPKVQQTQHLQTQILKNLEKELLLKGNQGILVPNAHLKLDTTSQWVLFSCEHCYKRSELMESVVPEFKARMKTLIVNGNLIMNHLMQKMIAWQQHQQQQPSSSSSSPQDSSTFVSQILYEMITNLTCFDYQQQQQQQSIYSSMEQSTTNSTTHRMMSHACPQCVYNCLVNRELQRVKFYQQQWNPFATASARKTTLSSFSTNSVSSSIWNLEYWK